ncbi:MAG: aspartate--ammonia ligase [Clostridiales bacterium]|nr:aspartate--ammonia ligase [Candidatus Apopatocola equi]MCQ2438715.1 aspartate--ammonia ligase [Oscillospiraceae bacterium]
MPCIIPEGYSPVLSVYETQRAIEFIKQSFQKNLGSALNLKRVSAPLFVPADSGLNDDLSGRERPVGFDVPAVAGCECQVVQSLAKWKRWALRQYNFFPGKGLYTDMNAIRRDEDTLDNLHSVYVDQWDWEKAILREERTVGYLQDTVRRIVSAICMTADELEWEFGRIHSKLDRGVFFITSQELEDRYPDLTPGERENAITREHGTVFLMQIGKTLRSGKPHDGRAPDYDDWELNGDILFYNDVLKRAFEISSMGIRVSPESLDRQLTLSGKDERRSLPYHKALLAGELPYSIGGGIGQSRLCMLLLGCAHIGEVQCGVWDTETREMCAKAGINLL